MSLITVLLIVAGLIGYYNLSTSHRALHKLEAVAEEIIVVGGLQHSLEHVLMPANDYLITGDRKYIDDFNVLSREVEDQLKKSEELLGYLEAFGLSHIEKEEKSLKDIKTAFLKIREISLKIFDIPNPIGNKDGARIMEEMDYRWGRPATAMLHTWQEGDIEEYKEAIEFAEKSRRMSWIIMALAATLLLILGAGFTAFYSKLFLRPIEVLHERADAIANGDFGEKLDIRTGDEIQQLANAMNEMAVQLDALYSNLNGMVEERTKELRESEERFRNIVETTSDWVWEVNENVIYTYASPKIREILGYEVKEILGKTPFDLMHKEEARRVAEIFDPIIAAQKPFNSLENSNRHKDGHIVILDTSGVPFFDAEGRFRGYRGIDRDITERKKAEEKLRVSEEMYRSLFDHMLNGFAYCRMLFEHGHPLDFIYLSVNDAFEVLTGLKGVVGKKVTEVIPGIREADPGLLEIYGRVALSGKPERFEMYVESLRMWFWISVYSPHKEHFVAVFDVITERKKAEEALKESEERFRTITNTAGDAIIGLEAPGMINFWNRKAEEVFGYPADEVTGRDMHDLIVPERYRGKAREGLKGFFQTGTGSVVGKTVELIALSRDGMEFPVALSISAMKIREKWQATGIIRDITERKRAEEELVKHVDELERYMKATVQREFRIKELRDSVEELEKRLKG